MKKHLKNLIESRVKIALLIATIQHNGQPIKQTACSMLNYSNTFEGTLHGVHRFAQRGHTIYQRVHILAQQGHTIYQQGHILAQ